MKRVWHLFRCRFKVLDLIWGNGESILKWLDRCPCIAAIASMTCPQQAMPLDLTAVWESVKQALCIPRGSFKETTTLAQC